MSSKRVINNKNYMVDGDMSADIFGEAVKIEGVDNILIQVSWVGNPVGVLTIEVSNDGLIWIQTEAAASKEPAGADEAAMIGLETSAAFARLVYDPTGGTGTMKAHFVGKGWS